MINVGAGSGVYVTVKGYGIGFDRVHEVVSIQ
jgi:hypothetical protein